MVAAGRWGALLAATTLLLAQACWCISTTTRLPVKPVVPHTPPAMTTTTTTVAPPVSRCSSLGRTNTSRAVELLREAMRQPRIVRDTALDAFIVVSTDEHQSEEPSVEDRRLEYISGWWGEGTAVIVSFMPEAQRLPSGRIPGYPLPLVQKVNASTTGAALWVPAGMFEQARRVIACTWDVYDKDDESSPAIAEWLSYRLGKETTRVGADHRLVEYEVWQNLSEQLDNYGLRLIPVPSLLDHVWDSDGRPQPNKVVTSVHEFQNSGRDWLSKVTELRRELRVLGADAMVVTALDEIAWLLNIRGRDLPYSPLVKCFLIVTYNELHLYIPQGKLNVDTRNSLGSNACFNANCTHVHDYSEVYMNLRTRAQPWRTVLIPSASNFHRGASEAIVQSVPESKRFLGVSPIIYMKAKKNPTEIENMVKVQITDGIAMCQLLEYFERTFTKVPWDEAKLSYETDQMRRWQPNNTGTARRTVAAFGANSAMPEYHVTNFSSARIFNNSTVLLTSGGQYLEGTTIVTRTLHLGKPSAQQRTAYTRVLQAFIALSSLTWPESLPATHLDVVARAPLWAQGKDYPHATGHGVGAFLNLREDPIKIDHNLVRNLDTLKEGYFVTVEPGWYESGKFGVRLGNVLEVVAAEGKDKDMKTGGMGARYLAFRSATLVPYEPNLIDVPSLTTHEKQWLNDYQARVNSTLGPLLKAQGMAEAYHWMTKKTKPLAEPTSSKHSANPSSAPHALPVAMLLLATAALILFSAAALPY